MPQDEPPHAEMIAWMRAHRKWVEPRDTEMANAVLAHLERTRHQDRVLALTRNALRELIDNDFAYQHLLAAIDAEAKSQNPPRVRPSSARRAAMPQGDTR